MEDYILGIIGTSSTIAIFILIVVIAICFVIFVLLPAIIIPIVVVKARNEYYREFVFKNSESLNKLREINKKYTFKEYKTVHNIYHLFDNKRTWTSVSCSAFLIRELRTNFSHWYQYKDIVSFNRALFKRYNNEILTTKFYVMPHSICSNNHLDVEKCRKIEDDLFKSIRLHPKTDIFIHVKLRYLSPQGRVDLMKNQYYQYKQFISALTNVSTERMDRDTYEKFVAAERGIINDSLRYDIMRRDGFKCVLCGASAKDGVILHVDHIIPVSKGGRSVRSNLRTLCERCNLGKSNKIE